MASCVSLLIMIISIIIIMLLFRRRPRALSTYLTFQEYYADLLKSIGDPTSLAAELYSAGLLSRETRINISVDLTLVDSQKVSVLLDAIETAIRLNPSNYHKFVEALEKDSSMQHLCGKLRSTCGECDNVCLSTSTDQCMVF